MYQNVWGESAWSFFVVCVVRFCCGWYTHCLAVVPSCGHFLLSGIFLLSVFSRIKPYSIDYSPVKLLFTPCNAYTLRHSSDVKSLTFHKLLVVINSQSRKLTHLAWSLTDPGFEHSPSIHCLKPLGHKISSDKFETGFKHLFLKTLLCIYQNLCSLNTFEGYR